MSTNVRPRRKSYDYDRAIRQGVAGGLAGCIAKTVVAPLDRVKILFQASNPDFQKYAGSWSGAFRAGAQIFHEMGVRGLLQGHSATLLRVFPYAGIKFLAYDQVHDALMPTPAHETNLRRFVAGACSGAISVFFTYPLELIRVRMAFHTQHTSANTSARLSFIQAARLVYREGAGMQTSAKPEFEAFPILKFYRGFTVSLIGIVPYAGTSFLAWGYLRSTILPPPPPGSTRRPSSPATDLATGAVCGVVAQTVSYPFEVVRRQMQVGGLTRPDRWLRWGETVRAVYARGGWRAFYVGLSIGWIKIVPMNAVSFAAWQGLKRLFDV
ncbi:mitochondrial carrier domain-containing protein [Vararia minispora EC-137]|uniref:Mitochondrial carrier domain-containing protein n=1 Tax=Vararia minispora EC-137 TaxID=1314806 RepID=A0ACB8QV48_9AGAM|nr:mitochondrial carrier domain-containing protein [Vararia minispora EC-137]